jgi:hypothetical protein
MKNPESMLQQSTGIQKQVHHLCWSYQHWTGLALVEGNMHEAVDILYHAPFAVVSHGVEADPIFNYANDRAMQLFRMSWDEITSLPSRLSAEAMLRSERANFLARVAKNGYVCDYSGIRIASDGKRFEIKNATVWNVVNSQGVCYGQAAMIADWEFL